MPKTFVYLLVGFVCCVCCSQLKAIDGPNHPECPTENPPQILVAASIDSDENLVLVSYHSIFIGFDGQAYNERLTTRVSLKDVVIRTAKGKKITVDEARKQIGSKDTPIVVTEYKKQAPRFYAKLFAPETLQFAFPKKSPEWKEIEAPGAPVEK